MADVVSVNVTDCTEILADFAGGPASGRQMVSPGDPAAIVLPDGDGHVQYLRRGVRDDGRRIYAYDARVSDG